MGVHSKQPYEVTVMRKCGRLLAEIVNGLGRIVCAGVTPKQLDWVAQEGIRSRGLTPSFLGYTPTWSAKPFPAHICVSVNDVVLHGIPDDRPFQNGDAVTIDMGAAWGGYHTDYAITVIVGEPNDSVGALNEAIRAALVAGIDAARAGNRIGDIGHAIQTTVHALGWSDGLLSDYSGHGVGKRLHEPPLVPNKGKAGRGALLSPGMCIAIEPSASARSSTTHVGQDGWSVIVSDGSPSVHWEHTVLITDGAPEILTLV